jgi:hypothetical protein
MAVEDTNRHLQRRAGESVQDAEEAATKARDSRVFRVLVVVGLIAYGIIHLAVTWIALQLAWGHRRGSADQAGALQELASKPGGPLVLMVVAIGLFALVPWRLGLAVWGFAWKRPPIRRKGKRWGSVGYAVLYAALGVTALKIALGGGSNTRGRERTVSAVLMEHASGRVLLVAVAAAIAGSGVFLGYKGIRRKFTDELVDGGSRPLVITGQVGYIAKGVAFVIVGILVAWASLSHDADRAAGLDAAFRTIKNQPSGPLWLTALALGIGCFGIYCFGWSRRARR